MTRTVTLAGTPFEVRELRPYNGLKAALMLVRYVRKSEPAMLLVLGWISARDNRDMGTMVQMAGQLWDLLEPELIAATDDLFAFLELATDIPQEFLRTEPTLREVLGLCKAVYELNDMQTLLGMARSLATPSAAMQQAQGMVEQLKPSAPAPEPAVAAHPVTPRGRAVGAAPKP